MASVNERVRLCASYMSPPSKASRLNTTATTMLVGALQVKLKQAALPQIGAPLFPTQVCFPFAMNAK
jgi:hypothetical protein